MEANLTDYVQGKIGASARRVLFTKWVGYAWEEVSAKQEMVRRSFQKAGISLPIDGSEDELIHVEGIDGYRVESSDEVDSEEDPLASGSDDDDESPSDEDI